MKNSHFTEQEISSIAEKMINNKYSLVSEEAKIHIDECDFCAEEILTISNLIENKSCNLIEKKGISRYFTTKRISIAIVASFFCISVGTYFLQQVESQSNVNIIDHNIPTVSENRNFIPKTEKESKLLAYQSNAKLETLVQRFNNNMRGDLIIVESTSTIESRSNDIELKWNNPDLKNFTLEFFDNQNQLISETMINGESYNVTLKDPGLYYWKLLNDDFDMVFCGRILIHQ